MLAVLNRGNGGPRGTLGREVPTVGVPVPDPLGSQGCSRSWECSHVQTSSPSVTPAGPSPWASRPWDWPQATGTQASSSLWLPWAEFLPLTAEEGAGSLPYAGELPLLGPAQGLGEALMPGHLSSRPFIHWGRRTCPGVSALAQGVDPTATCHACPPEDSGSFSGWRVLSGFLECLHTAIYLWIGDCGPDHTVEHSRARTPRRGSVGL